MHVIGEFLFINDICLALSEDHVPRIFKVLAVVEGNGFFGKFVPVLNVFPKLFSCWWEISLVEASPEPWGRFSRKKS